MRILLLSMPDSFEHMPTIGIRMPNGALSSLAGNVDPHHTVLVADLILAQKNVRETVIRLVQELNPQVVGLSIMTFQRKTALKIIALARTLLPSTKIVVGGYDASLASDVYSQPETGADFVVRGEGEITFRHLIRELEGDKKFSTIAGLSYRDGKEMKHNADRPISTLSGEEIRPPKREARILQGYQFLGNSVDVIETSRGCTYDCSFCSIIEMRGRNFYTYSIERVLEDIRDAYRHGARSIFFVDDNIGLNHKRFESLCRAIIDSRLNHIEYLVQAMTSTIANHGDTLAPLMKEAGFKYVFLGIENILDHDLKFLNAMSKNSNRNAGKRVGNASIQAIEHIHKNNMYVVGGMIVGNPDDTEESIRKNLAFVRQFVDYPYIQHPTPYPRTPMNKDFEEQGLMTDRPVEEFDGTTAVVRTKYLQQEEVEYLRWKSERWIKVRHAITILKDRPAFILKNAPRMFGFTFRGNNWRTFLGLENSHKAFERYRQIRKEEREYL